MKFDEVVFNALLKTDEIGRNLRVVESCESTMELCPKAFSTAIPHGSLVVARTQTAGRGRQGRSFVSESPNNLYFSFVIDPPEEGDWVTPLDAFRKYNVICAVASALCCDDAIAPASKRLSRLSPVQIKWPNDILIYGRKVSGMLLDVHAVGDGYRGIMGVGINVNTDPAVKHSELRGISTSLKNWTLSTSRGLPLEPILADFCNIFESLMKDPMSLVLERYRHWDRVVGRDVVIETHEEEFKARAVRFESTGALVVTRSLDDDDEEFVYSAKSLSFVDDSVSEAWHAELDNWFPGLADIPFFPVADLPTPVDRLDPESILPGKGLSSLLIKRDDISASPYGGNKVRKLEFLLGAALEEGADVSLTYGALGSNHALASAVHASRVGLQPHSVLKPQVNSVMVRKNLLGQAAFGAILHKAESAETIYDEGKTIRKSLEKEGLKVYEFPMGGSSPTGAIGFVNAGLELVAQVLDGICPQPDVIYVPVGSLGTVVGLCIGIGASWIKGGGLSALPIINAVKAVPADQCTREETLELLSETCDLLRKYDSDFPLAKDIWAVMDPVLFLRNEFFGTDYGRPTDLTRDALARAEEAGYQLEGTYSGKALSALIADGQDGKLSGKSALFWLTFNSRDLSVMLNSVSKDDVPSEFREVWEIPVVE